MSRKVLFFSLFLLGALGLIGLPASAQPEGLGRSPVDIGFSDFQPQSGLSRNCNFDPTSGRVQGSGTGICCVVAPVLLPDKVTVNGLTAYFLKSGSNNLSLQLRRKRLGTGINSEVMASIESNSFGASSTPRIAFDVSISNPTVDNATFTYFLGTDDCLDDGSLAIYSALVSFN